MLKCYYCNNMNKRILNRKKRHFLHFWRRHGYEVIAEFLGLIIITYALTVVFIRAVDYILVRYY